MPYKIDIQKQSDHLRVEVSGERTEDSAEQNARELWRKLIDLCWKYELRKILAISSLSGRFPTSGVFNIASNPQELGVDLSFRIGLVELNEESLEDMRFAESVALNRGAQFQVFDNEAEAKTWLFEG